MSSPDHAQSVPLTPPESRPTPTIADLAPAMPTPEELAKLLPKDTYLIEGFLGQGGMGAVYKAVQISLNRPVAIKIMQLGIGEAYDFADRFRREAQAMAALNHPNIVNVIDFGTAGGKYLYIVMEFIDGSDLHQVMRAKQMTPELALYLVPQICDALAYAHEHGIVHRDIKPANIMLTRDWRVKVADFGLAKRLEKTDTLVTQSNMSMGTPDYAAPEQFEMGVAIDHRADIYALGVTFYQMLTGELPRGAWQPPSEIVKTDKRLDPIVIKAMMPKRDQRYQSARELQHSVIGFTQTLAREAEQHSAQAEANARLEAQKKARAAAAASGKVPVVGTGKVPAAGSGKVPDRSAGASGKVPVAERSAGTPARSSNNGGEAAKSHPAGRSARAPVIPIAIGAAAVLGIGAFFLFGGKKDGGRAAGPSAAAHGAADANSPDAALAGASALPSTPIKVIDNKPASSSAGAASSLTLDPALQAKLDAVPWTRMDLAGKLESAYTVTQGKTAEFRNGKLELNGGYFLLIEKDAKDVALRVKFAPGDNRANVNLRAGTATRRIVAGRGTDGGKNSASVIAFHPTNNTKETLSPSLPLPAGRDPYTLESFAIGEIVAMAVDGRWVTGACPADIVRPGNIQIFGEHALIESIEYKILDGVVAPSLAAGGRAAGPPAAAAAPDQSQIPNPQSAISLDAPDWKRLDLAQVKEEPGKVERLPDGAVSLTGGIVWVDSSYGGDVAVRVRFRGGDSSNQRIRIRDEGGLAYMANVSRSGAGTLETYVTRENAELNQFKVEFPRLDTTKTFTLELRAQGSTLTVLVDGKQVAQTQDDQLKFGRLGVFADRGIVEGIAYQVGSTAAALAADEAGWQKMDLTTMTFPSEADRSERMPDGAFKIKRAFVWSRQTFADIGVRVRFRSTSRNDNPRVLVRERDGITYSLANDSLNRQVFGYEALQRGEKETKQAVLAKMNGSIKDVQTMELYVSGDQLTGFINGQKVVEARDAMLKTGRVGYYANEGIVESFEIKPIAIDRATVKPGELVWKTTLGESFTNGGVSQGADGTIYVAAKQELVALNPKDGAILWRTPFEGETRAGCVPVVADDGTVLLAVHGGKLHAFEGGTGKARWSFSFEEGGTFTESSPAVTADGKVFFGHRSAFCLDLTDGKQLWKTDFPNEVSRTPPVIAADGTVIFTPGGVVLALHPLNGAIKWQARFPNTVTADPALDGMTLYVNCNGSSAAANNHNGVLRAYDVSSGRMLWEHRTENFTEGNLALDASDRIFTRDMQGRVVACAASTGARLWNAHDKGEPNGYTIGSDGLIYTDLGKDFACLNPENGEVVWRFSPSRGNTIWQVPLITPYGLFVNGSGDREIYAIQTSSKGLADSPWPTMGQNNRRNGRAVNAKIVVAEDTPTDKKLREIEARARAEFDAGPGKVFTAAAAALRTFYANALRKNAAQSQKEGHLDDMLAFNQEADGFANGALTAPPVDAPSTPAALKQLRETFRKTLAQHEAARDGTAAPIYAKWDAALNLLQAELTKSGEINEALRVKKLREQVVFTKALTIPVAGASGPGGAAVGGAAGPAPGSMTPATTKTKAPAPKLARVDQRKLAEWVLSIPGSEVSFFKSDGKTWSSSIKKAADLPNGEIDLVKVLLNDAATAKEEDMLPLASCPRLREFRVQAGGYDCITPAVIAALGNLPDLTVVTLFGVNLEDADFAPLARCKELIAFRIADAPRFTGQALAYLPAAKMDALELRNCPVKDDALQAVERMSQLNQLNIEGLQITETALGRFPPGKLTNLRLARMPQLKGKLAAVKRFPKLERLHLDYWSGLNAEEAAAITSLPSLRFLSVTGITDDVLPLLAANTNLENLSLQPSASTPTTFKGLSVFAAHRKLKTLGLSQMAGDDALQGAAALVQLESLSLTDAKNITDAGMIHVARLSKLTRVSLKTTPITDAGLEPLKALKKLETLDLTGTKVTPAGIAAIKKALPKCEVKGP